ncbi:MAG: DUF5916 domain-containing protein [Pseudomonadales bacterium]|nr:DUF5916 domain-containing protein [Pseudomonadales bacterium]
MRARFCAWFLGEIVIRVFILLGLILAQSLGYGPVLAADATANVPQSARAGGVVIGSFASEANARRASLQASEVLANGAFNVDLQIMASVSKGKGLFRVVAVPQMGASSRQLLSELRDGGYPSAWHMSDVSKIDAGRPQRIASSQPTTDALNEKSQQVLVGSVSAKNVGKANDEFPRNIPQLLNTGPGEQTVYGTEAGVDLNKLAMATFVDAQVGVEIDGNIDESVWQDIAYFDNMRVSIPDIGTPGKYATKMRMFATEKGMYISADMEQPRDTLVRRMSRRDDFIDRDVFGVTLDVSGEAKIGYWFFIALGDSQSDGKVLPERRYQRDWDGPWVGKSAITDNGWSIEMFLPWSMMSMPETAGARNIGFAASRIISHANERYQWPGYGVTSARFVSALNKIEVQGVQPRTQMAMIPFIAATSDQVYNESDVRVGADLSWKPSPKVQLSATVNPDFGAVEADDVVLNLTASETFFPEKRLFFLEGSEIFNVMPRDDFSALYRIALNEDYATTSRRVYLNDFVPVPVSLLNTRRIGGTANQVGIPNGLTPERGQRDVPTDLLGAAKVTGTNGSFRYGALTAVEDDVSWLARNNANEPVKISDDGREFAVARLSYQLAGKAKKSVGYMGTFTSGSLYDAEIHSVDGHYTSSDGRLIADGQVIMSDRDEVSGYGALFDVLYANKPNLRHKFELDIMDDQINFNDLGFLRRNDYVKGRYVMLYNKQNLTEKLTNFRSAFSVQQQYNLEQGQVTDSAVLWRTSVVLPGRNTLRTGIGFLPERYEDIDSRGNGAYRVDAGGWFEMLVATDANKMFSYSAGITAQQEHLGDVTYGASAGVTIRPLDVLSMDFDLRYKKRNDWLVYQGGRNFASFDGDEWQPSFDVNWFIAPGHQLRWNMQWAGVRAEDTGFYTIPAADGDLQSGVRTQNNYDFNLGVFTTQLRYRWEIAPLTDFYLVYNRGNSLRTGDDADVSELLSDSIQDPVIDSVVAKLRYRFGN